MTPLAHRVTYTAIYQAITLAIFCTWIHLPARAQVREDTLKPKKERRITILPVPTLGVAPETGFSFGAVAQASFRLYLDSSTRYSTAKTELTYTLKKQFITELDWNIATRHNKQIFLSDNFFLRFPELFWGMGNQNTGGKGELYQARRIELSNEVNQKVISTIYLGITQRYQKVFGISTKAGGTFDTTTVVGKAGGVTSGLGLSLFSDSRDRLLNPSGGKHYIALRQLWFGRYVGSQFSFNQLELDARYYLSLGPSTLLALQSYHLMQSAGAPFRMQALLGSDSHMRGYYQGRYRDANYHTAQAELRFPIWRFLRGVAFAGAGGVAPKAFQLANAIKPTAGLGLRILVDKKEQTYMRFDYAVGKRTAGFYVAFGEAF